MDVGFLKITPDQAKANLDLGTGIPNCTNLPRLPETGFLLEFQSTSDVY